jgi:hypothetical protein
MAWFEALREDNMKKWSRHCVLFLFLDKNTHSYCTYT